VKGRSVFKKDVTGPALLEMDGKRVFQHLLTLRGSF
jgi:hypothetical protein